MTFVQLEYIVALDNYRQFTLAAESCFITQPTLSMQIQKLEEELGIMIFDRTKQPVATTEMGKEIIKQAKVILAQKQAMHELVQSKKGIVAGELKLGIIPTLAPYLLPLFIQNFASKYKQVKLIVSEMTTDNIIKSLTEGSIDAGILVTPLQKSGIKEYPLFYEELVAYVSRKNALYEKNYVLAQDIDPNKLWLLEEGHCFRSQIENLCELRKMSTAGSHFDYETGSIETLRRMVDLNDGITILPELATLDMPAKQLQLIRQFKKPVPMREVSIVVQRDFVKKRLIDALKNEIIQSIPDKIKKNQSVNVVPIKY
ncbi:MAG: hydrogen peroxide-inducible genes activator [Agriterribacter sp.]|nr:MAG: hydrogen peroxide-inducible genes activator [Sphingobacteriales bacterium 40-81]